MGSRPAYIGNKGDDLSGDAFTICLGNTLELVVCTPDNVHFCTVDGKRLNGHKADAGT